MSKERQYEEAEILDLSETSFIAGQTIIPAGIKRLILTGDGLQSLENVNFPEGLEEIIFDDDFTFSPLASAGNLEGASLPEIAKYVVPTGEVETLVGAVFPSSLKKLAVKANKICSLAGVVFPDDLEELDLSGNEIASLEGVAFPKGLQKLDISLNKLKSLEGAVFPCDLLSLNASNNHIESLQGIDFPEGLRILKVSNNDISSLLGVVFSQGLEEFGLDDNPIKSLEGVVFKSCLKELDLSYSGIETIDGVAMPSGVKIDIQETLLHKIINPGADKNGRDFKRARKKYADEDSFDKEESSSSIDPKSDDEYDLVGVVTGGATDPDMPE